MRLNLFHRNKKESAEVRLERKLVELEGFKTTLVAQLDASLQSSIRDFESKVLSLGNTLRSGFESSLNDRLGSSSRELSDLKEELSLSLRESLEESLEFIKAELPNRNREGSGDVRSSGYSIMGTPPLGSRECVEHWTRRMDGANYRRKEAMEAYQETLKGKG